jgi:23S rRNA pseudouridine1911/1915/1917 synthase
VPKREFLIAPSSGPGERVDVFLTAQLKALTRSQIQKLLREGRVTVSGRSQKPGYRLRGGEEIIIEYELPAESKISPQDMPLRVIYNDDDIIVIDKPSGMVVHPGAGVQAGTLANALLFHFPETGNVGPEQRPGIVHRLDKETSGVFVAARSELAYRALQQQFKNRSVEKIYLGLVWGRLPQKEGRITWAVGRHRKFGLKMSIHSRKPRDAETCYSVLQEFKNYSLLEIKPRTGRTHQIRVHFAAAGHPVAGDVRYGRRSKQKRFSRLFLHAHRLAFTHPRTGARVEFSSPLPDELKSLLNSLE